MKQTSLFRLLKAYVKGTLRKQEQRKRGVCRLCRFLDREIWGWHWLRFCHHRRWMGVKVRL